MTSSKRPGSRSAWNDHNSGLIPVTQQHRGGIPTTDLEAYGGDATNEAANIGGTTGDEKHGCWSSFSGCITGIWTTRQLANGKDREIYVKTTIRELIVYIFFLAILCFLTFGMASTNSYFFTQVLNDLFIGNQFDDSLTFNDIGEVDDVWDFLSDSMVPGLYPDTYYNGDERNDIDKNILYECKLLGMPRIRQIKVRNDSCVIPEDFKKAITVCYDMYSPDIEDKAAFGKINGSAWTYHSESELDGSTHWGQIATYSGAGSYEDLGTSADEARAVLDDLKSNLWITRGTRVVFVDFTVYNANINLFCVIKLVMEFPATGGVIPSFSFRTVKLIRYVTVFDYFILACEIIFCFFIVYYIVEEVLEIMKIKWPYFKSVWNLLDIIVILISLVCIAFSIYRTISVNRLLKELLTNPYQHANFEFLGFWQTQYNNAVALAIFFAWIKIFKYISFNKTMTQLSSTLSKCAKDIGGFAVMFFIVFFAFAQLGYLLFGSQVEDFSDFGTSVFTLLRMILGDFDFHAIETANRVLGPIFFITYVFFVFFVLLNMFLAIINDTYSEVKAEISKQKNEFEIGDYFLRGYNNVLGKLGRRDKIIDLQTAIKLADSNCDGTMSFDEIRRHLKQRNFCDTEIEMFFSKYDKDADKALSVSETKRMIADLEGEKLQIEKEIDTVKQGGELKLPAAQSTGINGVSFEEYCILTRRVDRMETSLGSIVSKIDAVLFKMEDLEKSKLKRREAMTKILDTINEKEAGERSENHVQMEQAVRDGLSALDGSTMSLPRNLQQKGH
ncbi:TRP-like ion channel Pkd2 [Chamberlinius hualienensis]